MSSVQVGFGCSLYSTLFIFCVSEHTSCLLDTCLTGSQWKKKKTNSSNKRPLQSINHHFNSASPRRRYGPTPPTTAHPRTLPTPPTPLPSPSTYSPITLPLHPRFPHRPPRPLIPIHNLPIRPRHKKSGGIIRAGRSFVASRSPTGGRGGARRWKQFGFGGWDDEAGGVQVIFEARVVGRQEFCLEAAPGLGDCLWDFAS